MEFRARSFVSNSGDLNGTWPLVYNAAWQLLETRTVSGQSQSTYRQFVRAGPGGGPDPQRPVVGAYIEDHVAMLDPAASGAAARHYYHADALYNTMALTDANGSVTRKVLYDPYGLATITDGSGNPAAPGSDGNPFLRQGIIRDWESELDEDRSSAPYVVRLGVRVARQRSDVDRQAVPRQLGTGFDVPDSDPPSNPPPPPGMTEFFEAWQNLCGIETAKIKPCPASVPVARTVSQGFRGNATWVCDDANNKAELLRQAGLDCSTAVVVAPPPTCHNGCKSANCREANRRLKPGNVVATNSQSASTAGQTICTLSFSCIIDYECPLAPYEGCGLFTYLCLNPWLLF